MAASLFAPGVTTITAVPDILDVSVMAELLRRLGCDVDHDRVAASLRISVPEQLHHQADYDLVRRMRASICVLVRSSRAATAPRSPCRAATPLVPVALTTLLGSIARCGGPASTATSSRLRTTGCREPRFGWTSPSIGATENLLTASVLAKGTTVIDNAPREPEIVDLCQMLVSMGARSGNRHRDA